MENADRNSIKRRLSEVLSINSVTGREKELGNYLENYMREVGLYVQIQDVSEGRFNVLGHTAKNLSNRPRMMLNAHYDVVPEGTGWTRSPFGGTIDGNDRMYGRGASDMKGGLVAMIESAANIQNRDLKDDGSDLVVAAVVDEEETQLGTKKIIEGGIRPSYAIVGEPTKLAVVIAHKGELALEIIIEGKSAHSSVPEKGINSIYQASKIIRELELRALAFQKLGKKKPHPLLGHPTLSVTMINGGNGPAIVPARTSITVDRRLLPGEDPNQIGKEFGNMIIRLREKEKGLGNVKTSMRKIIEAYPLEIKKDHPLVKVALRSRSEVMLAPSRTSGVPYTTDGWILANAGIPTLIMGPGDIERAHRPDEWVSLEEVSKASEIYSKIAMALLSES